MTGPEPAERTTGPVDEVHAGRNVASVSERWQTTGRETRCALVVAVAVAAITAALCIALAHAQPRQATRTAADPALTVSQTVDATGCPIGVSCTVVTTAAATLVSALRRTFGGTVVVQGGSQTTSGPRVYAWQLLASVRVGAVAVFAQCVPGASAVPGSASTTVFGHDDLSGNRRVDYRRSFVVVAGDRGCSVVVEIDASDSGDGTFDLARQLASDPTVQVHQ